MSKVVPYKYDPFRSHTSDNYALLGNPRQYFYRSRTKPILGGCIHITAGLDDFEGNDSSAEGAQEYGRTCTRPASWTGIVDSDSILDSLPDDYTAFAQGVPGYDFNSTMLSTEIGARSTDWNAKPDHWVAATLQNLARWWAPRVIRYRIPIVLRTNRDEIQRLINRGEPFGFTGHAYLTPSTRSDPGMVGSRDTFPWARFFDFLRAEVAALGGDPYAGATGNPLFDPVVKELQETLVEAGFPITVDGIYGDETKKAEKEYEMALKDIEDKLDRIGRDIGRIPGRVWSYENPATAFGDHDAWWHVRQAAVQADAAQTDTLAPTQQAFTFAGSGPISERTMAEMEAQYGPVTEVIEVEGAPETVAPGQAVDLPSGSEVAVLSEVGGWALSPANKAVVGALVGALVGLLSFLYAASENGLTAQEWIGAALAAIVGTGLSGAGAYFAPSNKPRPNR